MSNTVYIYVLKAPNCDAVRYVGKTKNLKNRLRSHIDYAKFNKKRRKVTDWINSILKQGKSPIIECIEETTDPEWPVRERFWIKHFRQNGSNLCNLTDGGESNTGYIYSDELKQVRRKARTGWILPDDVKKAIAKSLNRSVICINTGEVYPSLKSAIASSGVPKSTFHRKIHKGQLINGMKYQYHNTQNK